MDEYTVGNCEIEISDCPKISVYNLNLKSYQRTIPLDYPGGTYSKSIGPVEWEVNFKISDRALQDNIQQLWFRQFNSRSQINAHLGREKLKLCLDANYSLTLIGYLMLPSIDYEIGITWFTFNFNGTVGEDISLVPNLYEDESNIGAPTTEELAEDFEYMTKKVIAEAKPKPEFKKKVSFKKSDEIIVIQRKITF